MSLSQKVGRYQTAVPTSAARGRAPRALSGRPPYQDNRAIAALGCPPSPELPMTSHLSNQHHDQGYGVRSGPSLHERRQAQRCVRLRDNIATASWECRIVGALEGIPA